MFMKPEYVESDWIIIDGTNGVSVYDKSMFTICEAIDEYGYSGITSIDVDYGVCARLSASGYMDCTDWIGPFQNEHAAADILAHMYPEGESV